MVLGLKGVAHPGGSTFLRIVAGATRARLRAEWIALGPLCGFQ